MGAVIETEREANETTRRRQDTTTSKRLLEPIDRISEIWFGLIMVLTFTCSLSVKAAGQQEVRTMLIDAIGCNIAWGIIDGFIYLLGCFVERGRGISALRAVRAADTPSVAHRIIADAIPPLLATVLSPGEFEAMRRKLKELPEPPARPKLTKEEWLGGAGVFLAVFLSTFPVVIPFILMSDARLALRISNVIAVVMLFLTGYAFGRYAGYRPWRMGFWMAVLGSGLVAAAIALGG